MSAPLRVLHLEDDLRDAELVRATLEEEGIGSELMRLETEQDFIAALNGGSFDLILADYTLPSFDGLAALRIARQRAPEVPFVFVSGTLGEDVAIEALKTGATDYVLKTRLARLGLAVKRALREAQEKAERKRAVEALRASEERFRALVQFSFDAYWESDAQHRFLRQEFAEGLDNAPAPGSLIGKTRWEVPYLEPDEAAWRQHRATLDAHLPFRDFELARPTPDGGKRYVSVSGLPVFDDTGRFIGYRGVARDITERKQAEYLTRQAFESAPDGVAVVGRDYRFQRVNAVYERNWKIPVERIVGMHITDLTGSSELFEQTIKPNLDRCFSGEHVRFAEWFTNRRGRYYLSVSYSPLRLHSERIDAALAITRDLTDHMLLFDALREAQAELARVNRVTTLGVLAASIAHEVNQPLGSILASVGPCLRWLNAQPPDLGSARSALERIANDAERASQVISRIRALVKRQAPRKDRVDINEAILEAIALTRDEMRTHEIRLETRLAEGLPPLQGDRIQLQQVILNLIVNAIEAMSTIGDRPRQLAIVAVNDAQQGVRAEVRDSGPGVDADRAEQLFEVFYTTKVEGLGMGLSISRSIIEAHGGRLWTTPNLPHGTIFQFSLPVEEPPL